MVITHVPTNKKLNDCKQTLATSHQLIKYFETESKKYQKTNEKERSRALEIEALKERNKKAGFMYAAFLLLSKKDFNTLESYNKKLER